MALTFFLNVNGLDSVQRLSMETQQQRDDDEN